MQFELSTGQIVHVDAVTGFVADHQRSSTTEIRSSGGGGLITPSGGFIEAPRLEAQTTRQQSIWITDAAGRDHEVTLYNIDIPVRVGQRVTAYLSRPDGDEVGRYEGLFNHSAQTYSFLAPHFRPPFDLMRGYRGSMLLTLTVVAALATGWYGWARVDDASNQASMIHSRSPFCQAPDPNVWMTAAARRAAQIAFNDCKANMPAIAAEYRKATETHAALTRQANYWTFAIVGCVLVVLTGWIIRLVRRSHHRKSTWGEYLQKLEAIVSSGRVL